MPSTRPDTRPDVPPKEKVGFAAIVVTVKFSALPLTDTPRYRLPLPSPAKKSVAFAKTRELGEVPKPVATVVKLVAESGAAGVGALGHAMMPFGDVCEPCGG